MTPPRTWRLYEVPPSTKGDATLKIPFLLLFVRVAYIPEVLVKMRVGGASNRSLWNIIQKSREDFRALRNNGIGGLATLLMKNFQKLPQFFTRSGGR